jgi:hypothetical protein
VNARIATGPGTIQLSDEEALALSSWMANSGLGAIRAEISNAVQDDRPAVFSQEQKRQLVELLERRMPDPLVMGATFGMLLSALRADLEEPR